MLIYRSRQFSYQNRIAAAAVGVGLIAAIATVATTGVWAEAPVLVIILVAVIIALLFVPVTITVEDDGAGVDDSDAVLNVNLAGVMRRSIALSDVIKVERRDYRPVREFGGWGWRQAWKRRADAYSTRGTSAVVLTLRSGAEVYLGVSDEQGLLETLRTRIYR